VRRLCRGDDVLQVLAVDRTIEPPSFCVELCGSGTVRETERHRLQLRQPGTAPPLATPSAAAQVQPPVAAFSPGRRPEAAVPAVAANEHAAWKPASVPAASAEDDGFGDFAAATADGPPPTLSAAPLPMPLAPATPVPPLSPRGGAAMPAATNEQHTAGPRSTHHGEARGAC
jgi:hypothetical protein